MKMRSVVLTATSIVIGVLLIAAFISVAKVDPHATLRQLAGANRVAFLRLAALMAFNIFLSGLKWQLMDRVIRRESDAALSKSTFFAVTSAGVALGQLLPIQVSMVIARVLGTQLHGRALTRGTVGTVFDQGSDFLIVCFLIPASLLTHFSGSGPVVWLGLAVSMALLAIATVGGMVGVVQRLAAHFAAGAKAASNRWRRGCTDLIQSGLLERNLVRKLLGISILRFVVVVLMAGETSHAIRSTIPIWHLAAAMPFVVLSSALAITPGGIGVNEFTYATALSMFGTPLAAAAQWALANRALTAAAAFAVAICTAGGLLLSSSRKFYRRRNALEAAAKTEVATSFLRG